MDYAEYQNTPLNATSAQEAREATTPYRLMKYKETAGASRNWESAKDALNTNIVPRQYNEAIINSQTNPLKYLQRPGQTRLDNSDGVYMSQLSGQPITDFDHNNMVPFQGPKSRQNMAEYANSALLEKFTGVENFAIERKETEPLFNPTPTLANNFGTPDTIEENLTYIVPSKQRNNELPFEQLRVGPGLNAGYTNIPSGGFQQADGLDYIRPKTVDELRVATNPKISYHGRVIPGMFMVGKQTAKSAVEKNRPDTFYVNSPDRYFTTTGAYLKEKKRPCVVLKDTNRKASKAYTGSAAPAYVRQPTAREKYQESDRQNFENDYMRNAYRPDIWGNDEFGDYGKQGYNPPAQERDITGSRRHITNLLSLVKAITAPLQDIMRTTTKETTEENYRPNGELQAQRPSAGVAWDPNDVARTTIKETTEDTVRQFGDISQGVKKGTAWDPNDLARTTTKETTEETARPYGDVTNSVKKGQVWDCNDVARTTTKETTEELGRYGVAGGENVGDRNMGYLTNPQYAPNTNRQYTSDYEYEGVAYSKDPKPMSYDSDYNMRPNIVKEGTLIGRYPTPESSKLSVGGDMYNIDVKKMDNDRVVSRQPMSTLVYQPIADTATQCARTNDRQTYDDNKIGVDRINPELLDAFRSNPYTQSLESYVFP